MLEMHYLRPHLKLVKQRKNTNTYIFILFIFDINFVDKDTTINETKNKNR